MSIYMTKVLASVVIFLIAFFAGRLPGWLQSRSGENDWIEYTSTFARGIFLGAGLIHLLPEANEALTRSQIHLHVPLIAIITVSTISLLLLMEMSLSYYIYYHDSRNNRWVPILLFMLLSVHSVFAGAALGLQLVLSHIFVLLFAIIAHKGSAAFALSMSMKNHNLPDKLSLILLTVFAVMTPIGIHIGSLFDAFVNTQYGLFIEALIDAFSAGVFIYIAIFDKVSHGKSAKYLPNITYFLLYAFGLTIMAIIGAIGV